MRLVKYSTISKRKKSKTLDKKLYAFAIIFACVVFVFVKLKPFNQGSTNIYNVQLGPYAKLLFQNHSGLSDLEDIIKTTTTEESIVIPHFTPKCQRRYFKINNMTDCHPWLTCEEVYGDVENGQYIEKGKTKKIQKGIWNGFEVAIMHAIEEKGKSRLEEFHQHLKNLITLQSPFTTQLIGYCNVSKGAASVFTRSYIVTELHFRRSLAEFIRSNEYSIRDPRMRLNLAISFLEVLNFLHTRPDGARVLCESTELQSTLNDFLITEDGKVILSDLDDLAKVNATNGANCQHLDEVSENVNILHEHFLSPEEISKLVSFYPESAVAKVVKRSEQGQSLPKPFISEKTDIYKVPAISEAIILPKDKYNAVAKTILIKLGPIHKRCLEQDPQKRPSATELVKFYFKVYKEMLLHNDRAS